MKALHYNEPHYHNRIASVGKELIVPKDVLGMHFMRCPLSEGTDCYWDFIDPLPNGTHQLRYVKNMPTNAKPDSTT